ncbi:MAG: T9SS type A sorting domain-containing protein, partial [Flavobacteriales bacterium]|nr:T9SS type A sorting domain-containing protein [Flavobacteriales bacterium]
WGSYHGYGDASTTDPAQRMVSRLHGFNVGVQELQPAQTPLHVWPNPAGGEVNVDVGGAIGNAGLVLRDATGRTVRSEAMRGERHRLSLHGVAAGVYLLALEKGGATVATARLVVEP